MQTIDPSDRLYRALDQRIRAVLGVESPPDLSVLEFGPRPGPWMIQQLNRYSDREHTARLFWWWGEWHR